MSIKYLIALDLDGTLLNEESKITPRTRDYLFDLSSKGHHIVIATGRPLRAAISFQKELGIKAPIVCHNGALATHLYDENFPKRARTFDLNTIKDICKHIGDFNLGNLMVETETTVYLKHFDENLNAFFWNNLGTIVYGDPFVSLKQNPLTTLFYFKNLTTERKKEISDIVETYGGYHIRFWNLEGYAEIYTDECTKKEALEHVVKALDIPWEHTIAFGDAYNDSEMLSWANHSFCMKNGSDKIKEIAKYVTLDDHNNDGIMTSLQRLIK